MVNAAFLLFRPSSRWARGPSVSPSPSEIKPWAPSPSPICCCRSSPPSGCRRLAVGTPCARYLAMRKIYKVFQTPCCELYSCGAPSWRRTCHMINHGCTMTQVTVTNRWRFNGTNAQVLLRVLAEPANPWHPKGPSTNPRLQAHCSSPRTPRWYLLETT